jgi:D-alanyl-D-alanine carboxypeptidase (penicillin-binding protein 5/6)
MELYRLAGNNLGLANSLQSLGDLESRIGKTQEAEERYTQAIQIYRNEGANLGLANALKSLGDVETEAGNLGVAQDHYEQAIELYRTGGRTLGLANALQRLGDLKRIQKRFKEATGHYSTARDLTLLADYAMANPDFRAVVSTAHYVVPATALHRDYTWDTTNNLLTKKSYYNGIEGVKTGHTENAGYCLVFEAAHTDKRLVGVVLGEKTDPGRFSDAVALLDWGFGSQKAA